MNEDEMKADLKKKRRREIEAAAYELVTEKGYGGTSMLAIAKRARASNETLYNWYGNKLELFRTLIKTNAAVARKVLNDTLEKQNGFDEGMCDFGTVLLMSILGEHAVALNRAAAADSTGELGKALGEAGRGMVLPLLEQLFSRNFPEGAFGTLPDMIETYLFLLIGDRQIRRVTENLPEPSEDECRKASERALELFKCLLESGTFQQ